MDSAELVVLLSESGEPVGSALKSEVHHADTPLHLAFSCHVFDNEGRLLMTRRALDKKTWPGVWTNSFCGHPAPAESVEDAIHRRGREELQLSVSGVTPLLPDFRYSATDPQGTVENEICPVYYAHATTIVTPEPSEVVEYVWANPGDVRAAVQATPWAFSPWLVAQLEQIGAGHGTPWAH